MTTPIEKTVLVNAPASTVWEHLTKPELMKKWMGEEELEIEVITDWKEGNPIVITGFHHARFENKGIVLQFVPGKILQYSHLSSVSGLEDKHENYSVITFNLVPDKNQTFLTIKVENFPTETIYKHFDFYWKTTLEIIKREIE